MATINCSSPKDANEISLCACKEGVDTYKKLSDEYTQKCIKFASDDASYQRWIAAHNNWKAKTGAYESWLKAYNDKDVTFVKHLNWDVGWRPKGYIDNPDYNHQCGAEASNKGLFDPWAYYANDVWYNGQPINKGDAGCARRENLKFDHITKPYTDAEPKTDPQDASKTWLNVAAPKNDAVPPVYKGTCCSQIFQNITSTGGDINMDNISQQCGAAPAPAPPAPTSAPTSAPAPAPASTTTSTTPPTSTASKKKDDDKKKIIIGVLVSLCICICICCLIVIMLMS